MTSILDRSFQKAGVHPIVIKNSKKGKLMASLQEAVIKKFLETLGANENFDQSKTAKIEALIKSNGKIKSDDLAVIFSLPEGGEIL